jgi:hypothetical protein
VKRIGVFLFSIGFPGDKHRLSTYQVIEALAIPLFERVVAL